MTLCPPWSPISVTPIQQLIACSKLVMVSCGTSTRPIADRDSLKSKSTPFLKSLNTLIPLASVTLLNFPLIILRVVSLNTPGSMPLSSSPMAPRRSQYPEPVLPLPLASQDAGSKDTTRWPVLRGWPTSPSGKMSMAISLPYAILLMVSLDSI